MEMIVLMVGLISWVVSGAIGGWIAVQTGYEEGDMMGWVLGLLLGPLGWLLVWFLSPDFKGKTAAGNERASDKIESLEAELTRMKIAKLETELAALKGQGKAGNPPSKSSFEDTLDPPTYKLD